MRSLIPSLVLALWASVLACPALANPLTLLIEERAVEALAHQMPDDARFDIRMLTPGPHEALLISDFWMDAASGQFVANAVTQDGGVHRVQGMAVLTVAVPVPLRRIMPDEILRTEDFQITPLPYRSVGSFAVTRIEDLAGMQVRRMLSPGRPVVSQSVTQPLVIERGARVMLVYRQGPLDLSAPGRALSSAHLQQDVRVINLSSNKTVVGIARGNGLVEVSN
ncbi:flagellar basal body P-ring formation protein FlgA [Tabrizicola sp. WMC-M-20]|nr:flagellar basal body P-ring formation protein FlgA [Tabrizicola sp. WMC-M-20]